MSFESQLTIIIIHYIGFFGLMVSALLSLFMTNRKNKLLFMFLAFLFVGVLSFAYYSGALFFIVGIIILFFFLSLYLFVFQVRLFGNKEKLKQDGKSNNSNTVKIFNVLLPLSFCAAIGYLIYIYTSGFLRNITVTKEITIVGLSDITGLFLTDHSLVLILVVALLFISFLWFLIIGLDKK